MATTPEVPTADVISDHPVLNLLSDGAKNALKAALKPLFAQATCAYAAIPCPRNLELWPPPSRDPLEKSSTSKAAQISKIQADKIALVREGLSGQFAYGAPAIHVPSPVIFEGKEYFVIEQPSPDIVILSTMESAQAISRAQGVAFVPPAPPAPPDKPSGGTAATPSAPAINVPDNFCGGFFGPVSGSGDRGITVFFGAGAQIGTFAIGGSAFLSGDYWVEYLNSSPTGGPCAPGACISETSLVASMRVGITAKAFVELRAGVVIPGIGPVGPSVGGYFGIEINTEGLVDCIIPTV